MRTNLFFILVVFILNFSCNSEDITEAPNSDDFFALKVGNLWNYTYYLKDTTTGNFNVTAVNETVQITNTTIINNKIYYNFKYTIVGNNGSYNLLPDNSETNFTFRDSLGYLVDELGSIKYSSNNYNEHIVDSMAGNDYSYFLKLSDEEDVLTTNAGNFTCSDNHYYFKHTDGNITNSTDHIYRESGKGEILSTISYMSQNEHYAEKRLESYTLQ